MCPWLSGSLLLRPIQRALQLASMCILIGTGLCPGAGRVWAEMEGCPADSPVVQPEHVVRAFYDAVATGNCTQALGLNPGYTLARCQRQQDIQVHETTLRFRDTTRAVVYLHVTSISQDARGRHHHAFRGHVTLHAVQDRWVIEDDSYKRLSTLDANAYLRWLNLRYPATATPLAPVSPPLPAGHATDLALGSQTILAALWTPQQLQGHTEEKRVVRLSTPDHTPPERREPLQRIAPLEAQWHGSIRRVELPPDQKIVALTFDLCERAEDRTGYDAPIVDYLRAKQVRATFYAGGKWMQSHEDRAMQLMADRLFELGNHSWSHANLRQLTGPHLAEQIQGTQAQYELLREKLVTRASEAYKVDSQDLAQIPPVPMTFRFPYGTCSPEALRVVADAGLPAIQWDVVSGDPSRHQSAPQMAEAVVRQTKPGSIIIFHANGRGYGTAEALPRIVTALRERGFQFVTVSELLRHGLQFGRIQPLEECYEMRPGDNRRYDKLFREDGSK